MPMAGCHKPRGKYIVTGGKGLHRGRDTRRRQGAAQPLGQGDDEQAVGTVAHAAGECHQRGKEGLKIAGKFRLVGHKNGLFLSW